MSLSREDLMSPGFDRLQSPSNNAAVRQAVAAAASAAAAAAFHSHQSSRRQFSPSQGSRGFEQPAPSPRRGELSESAADTTAVRPGVSEDFDFSRTSRDSRTTLATNELLMKSRETIMRLQQELEAERAKVRTLSSEITLAKRELSDEKLSASSSQHGATLAADKETRLLRELGLLKANERVLRAKCEELEREIERLDKAEQRAAHFEDTLRIREEELSIERDMIRGLQETIKSKDELLKETTVTLCNLDEKLNSQDSQRSRNVDSLQQELTQLKVENARLKAEGKEAAVQMALNYNESANQFKSLVDGQLNKLELRVQSLRGEEDQLKRMLESQAKLKRAVDPLEQGRRERELLEQQRALNESARQEYSAQLDRMQKMFEEKLRGFEQAAMQGDWARLAQQTSAARSSVNGGQSSNMQPNQQNQQNQFQPNAFSSPSKAQVSSQQPQFQQFSGFQQSASSPAPQQSFEPNGSFSASSRQGFDGQADGQGATTNISIKVVPKEGEGSTTTEVTTSTGLPAHYEAELRRLHDRLVALQASESLSESDRVAAISSLEHKVKKLKVRFAHDQRTIGEKQAEIKRLKKKIQAYEERVGNMESGAVKEKEEEIEQLREELRRANKELSIKEEKAAQEGRLRRAAEHQAEKLAALAEQRQQKNASLGVEREKLLSLLKGAMEAGQKGESLHSGLMKKLERVIMTVEGELQKESKKVEKMAADKENFRHYPSDSN